MAFVTLDPVAAGKRQEANTRSKVPPCHDTNWLPPFLYQRYHVTHWPSSTNHIPMFKSALWVFKPRLTPRGQRSVRDRREVYGMIHRSRPSRNRRMKKTLTTCGLHWIERRKKPLPRRTRKYPPPSLPPRWSGFTNSYTFKKLTPSAHTNSHNWILTKIIAILLSLVCKSLGIFENSPCYCRQLGVNSAFIENMWQGWYCRGWATQVLCESPPDRFGYAHFPARDIWEKCQNSFTGLEMKYAKPNNSSRIVLNCSIHVEIDLSAGIWKSACCSWLDKPQWTRIAINFTSSKIQCIAWVSERHGNGPSCPRDIVQSASPHGLSGLRHESLSSAPLIV